MNARFKTPSQKAFNGTLMAATRLSLDPNDELAQQLMEVCIELTTLIHQSMRMEAVIHGYTKEKEHDVSD